MRNVVVSALLVIGLAAPAAADVTLTGTTSIKGIISGEGASKQMLKGSKMRMDQVIRGENTSTIFDIDAQTMTTVNHNKKEAEVFPMASFQKSLDDVNFAPPEISFKPNGESKTIAGEKCDGYIMSIALSAGANAKNSGLPENVTMLLTGPVFVSKHSPAMDEFKAFYSKAVEHGFFFTAPSAAKAQPGIAKSYQKMYSELARIGVPYEQTTEVKFDGGGMFGAMLNKMAAMKNTVVITDVSSEAIPDSAFEIPAGYKVKQAR